MAIFISRQNSTRHATLPRLEAADFTTLNHAEFDSGSLAKISNLFTTIPRARSLYRCP